jgi:DNA-binding IclR family transcriptional regulator
LRKEITAARRDGFGYSREEYTQGITGLAIAVSDQGRLLGALNLAVPTVRFTAEQEARFRDRMTSVAAALGHALRSLAKA